MPSFCGSLERVAIHSALSVDVGALIEQQLCDLRVPFRYGSLEYVAIPSALSVDVGALVDQ
jgi:hypothetical protein